MSEIAFKPGLEDIAVAETRMSSIDGEGGNLTIGGFPLEEIAPKATYEEAVYLLLNDRLPEKEELDAFRADLASRRGLSDPVKTVIRQAAREGKPAMDALRMGGAAANLGAEAEKPPIEARRIIACFPTIIATYWRFHQGKSPVPPRENLGHAANYLYMLSGEEPDESDVRGLETYLNAVIDHGINASTFAARTVVSTESDLLSAAIAAVGALKGPLHGGAPGPVLDMLKEVHKDGDPESHVRNRLDAGKRLMGFGHRVYRTRDPRATVLSSAAERFYSQSANEDFFETARELEKVGARLLAAHKPDRDLETNVEFYTAVLLHGIGVPQELFTATFAVSRVGGWMAHGLEQKSKNRLIRPRSRYIGETGRAWTELRKR